MTLDDESLYVLAAHRIVVIGVGVFLSSHALAFFFHPRTSSILKGVGSVKGVGVWYINL